MLSISRTLCLIYSLLCELLDLNFDHDHEKKLLITHDTQYTSSHESIVFEEYCIDKRTDSFIDINIFKVNVYALTVQHQYIFLSFTIQSPTKYNKSSYNDNIYCKWIKNQRSLTKSFNEFNIQFCSCWIYVIMYLKWIV